MQPLGCGLVIQPRFNGHIIQGQVVIHHSHQHRLPHPVQIFRVNAKLPGDFGQLLPVGLRPSFIIGIDKLEGHGPGIAAKHNAVFCDNRGTIAGGGIRVQHKGRLVGDGIAAHLFLFTAIGMIWSFLSLLRGLLLGPRPLLPELLNFTVRIDAVFRHARALQIALDHGVQIHHIQNFRGGLGSRQNKCPALVNGRGGTQFLRLGKHGFKSHIQLLASQLLRHWRQGIVFIHELPCADYQRLQQLFV